MTPKDVESGSEVDTKDSFSQEHFYKAFKLLTCATYWKGDDGILHKLTPSLKLVYSHRFEQFNSYTQQGLNYFESNQQVSDLTGISVRVIVDSVNPLLKKMGLLEINKVSFNKYNVVVNPVSVHKGSLLNPTLTKANYSDKKVNKTSQQWISYQLNSDKIDILCKEKLVIDLEIKTIKEDMFNLKGSDEGFKLAPTTKEED